MLTSALALAAIFPVTPPDTACARIVLLQVELFNIDGAGLTRFDQASAAFLHTAKETPPVQEPPSGGCIAGAAPPGDVEGFALGAIPVLRASLPGRGIPQNQPVRIVSGEVVRVLPPQPGAPGLYSATVGGSRSGVAAARPPFFSSQAPRLLLGSQTPLPVVRTFAWPERERVPAIQPARPYPIRWVGPGPGVMLILLAASRPDRSASWVVCAPSSAQASFSIPARFVAALPRDSPATLVLSWIPPGAWTPLELSDFASAWAVALHVQGAAAPWR